MKLTGKVAVITGAGSGIGQAVARGYLEQGAHCLLVDLKSDAQLRQPFEDVPEQCLATLILDLSTRESIQAVVEAAIEGFGRIDILFNNAAVFDMGPFLDESWDAYDRIFSVNVRSMFFLLQAVARQMVKQGQGGKIINMA